MSQTKDSGTGCECRRCDTLHPAIHWISPRRTCTIAEANQKENYELGDIHRGGLQLSNHAIAYLGTTVKRQKRILQSCSTAANIDNATTLVLYHFGKHCTSHPAGGANIHLKHGFDIVIGKFLHVQEESGTKFSAAHHTFNTNEKSLLTWKNMGWS